MLGGVALMIFGAGLVLSNPTVRRYLGQVGLGEFGLGGIARSGALFPPALHVEQGGAAVIAIPVRTMPPRFCNPVR